jgi:hypothetical protein
MKLIYKADQSVQAHLLKGALQTHAIEALVQGDLLAGAMGELPAYGLIHVWVADEDYSSAISVLDAWQAGEFAIDDQFNSDSPAEAGET